MNQYELPWIALNQGASYRGLHDSLVNYGDNRPEIILCPHEEIASVRGAGIRQGDREADDCGGSRHCWPPTLCAGRLPRLSRPRATSAGGRHGPARSAKRRPGADWIHTAIPQAQPLHDFLKWDRTPLTAQEVVDSFARAYRIMLQEPQGPVHLCYDAGFQEEPLEEVVELPDPGEVQPWDAHAG